MKPYPAMVKEPEFDHTHDTMMKSQYVPLHETSGKRSPIYRFFFARDADFTIKENPYQKMHPDDIWDPRKGQYSTYSNNFGQHHQ